MLEYGRHLLSSESVSEGHPDKVADHISDAVLDAILEQDPQGRVACEVYVKGSMVLVGGEISSTAKIDVEPLVRRTLESIGYDDPALGFDASSCSVLCALTQQSRDISEGIRIFDPESQGAGDQGTVFGYASRETPSFMPAPIAYAHQLMYQQAQLRKSQRFPWLRPDAKAQLTFSYDNNQIIGIESCVLSTQHSDEIDIHSLQEIVLKEIILPCLPEKWLKSTEFFINPTGRFILGGPQADCGLTGRKLMVDTYGSAVRHGGGAFSGKDASKVDRSAAYMARYLAKNIVAAGLAQRCELQLSYAIGIAQPVAVHCNTFGTGKHADDWLSLWLKMHFDLTPYGMNQSLQLTRPIYKNTCNYGHFGRDGFAWEALDQVDFLLAHLS